MTILNELRAEVQKVWRSSPTQTVLWLDPQREWERRLDQLLQATAFLLRHTPRQAVIRLASPTS